MTVKEIQDLRERLNDMKSAYIDAIDTINLQISENNRQISRLQEENKGLKRQREREKQHTEPHIQSIQKSLNEEVGTLNKAYGRYNVKTLGPIIAKLVSSITREPYDFEIKTDEWAETYVHDFKVTYNREKAVIVNKKNQTSFTFAVSEKPHDNDFINEWGILYDYGRDIDKAPKSYFSFMGDTVAKFDIDKESFVWSKIWGENEPYDFVQDFISYVSNYRLANDIKKISAEELEQLARAFLEEHKDDYQERRQKRHVIKPTKEKKGIFPFWPKK